VTRVNGTPVVGTGVTLTELLKNPGNDLPAKAAAIAAASARHIIGSRKALVMPTVSLEALSAANHPRYVFKLRGQSRVRGTQTRRLDFTEFDEPTLVQAADGSVLWSRGSVWMEPDTGVVWRAELIVGPDRPGRPHRLDLESKVRVEFALDAALDMMVPRELSEQYWIRGGTGFGKGKYSNFRKLGRNGGTW
jgi:hypothetical protein